MFAVPLEIAARSVSFQQLLLCVIGFLTHSCITIHHSSTCIDLAGTYLKMTYVYESDMRDMAIDLFHGFCIAAF